MGGESNHSIVHPSARNNMQGNAHLTCEACFYQAKYRLQTMQVHAMNSGAWTRGVTTVCQWQALQPHCMPLHNKGLGIVHVLQAPQISKCEHPTDWWLKNQDTHAEPKMVACSYVDNDVHHRASPERLYLQVC